MWVKGFVHGCDSEFGRTENLTKARWSLPALPHVSQSSPSPHTPQPHIPLTLGPCPGVTEGT